jgi:hypothetical protein
VTSIIGILEHINLVADIIYHIKYQLQTYIYLHKSIHILLSYTVDVYTHFVSNKRIRHDLKISTQFTYFVTVDLHKTFSKKFVTIFKIYLSIYLSICRSVGPSIYPFVYMSVYFIILLKGPAADAKDAPQP